MIQTLIFAIILSIKSQWSIAAIELLAGLVFSIFFVYIYSKKQFKAE